MSKAILALLVVASLSCYGWAAPPSLAAHADDPAEMLSRAEALYYDADFAKSVELLQRADELLRQPTGNLQQKASVKLQLALGFIGLNDNARAKSYLGELYLLDSDHRLDPQMFSPKVIQLADEARVEQEELHCQSLFADIEKQLAAGSSAVVVKMIDSGKTNCAGLVSFYPMAADLVFKEGLAFYKNAQLAEALQKFREALTVEPKHELAAQYVDLTAGKLEVTAERALYAWRKDFNSGDFALAARDYREVKALSDAQVGGQTMDELQNEYRRSVNSLVDSWNRACAGDDTAKMEVIRGQINTLLPETSFAEDILARMKTCVHTNCIQMDAQLALVRLKTRVEPQFSGALISQIQSFPVTVHVKARVTDKGDVSSMDMQGGNPLLYSAIRTAIDQWKFIPTVIYGQGPRCMDTEIPIVINKK